MIGIVRNDENKNMEITMEKTTLIVMKDCDYLWCRFWSSPPTHFTMAIEQEKQKVTTIQQRCTWWTSLGGPVMYLCRTGADAMQTATVLIWRCCAFSRAWRIMANHGESWRQDGLH